MISTNGFRDCRALSEDPSLLARRNHANSPTSLPLGELLDDDSRVTGLFRVIIKIKKENPNAHRSRLEYRHVDTPIATKRSGLSRFTLLNIIYIFNKKKIRWKNDARNIGPRECFIVEGGRRSVCSATGQGRTARPQRAQDIGAA